VDIKQLKEVVGKLFTDRSTYVILLQEIAENFYPERADFTVSRTHGSEFAGNLMTSYPILTRRDLGDQIGSMLRPTEKQWFRIVPEDEDRENNEAKRWLERTAAIQRKAMYDRKSLFTRATKEADHDFAAFGQCVISCRLNKQADGLLYRNWHLRDVVWQENEDGVIGLIGRKWKPTARDMVRLFPKVHEHVSRANEKEPFKTFNCYHIICDADMYEGNTLGRPYWSIYYDCDNEHVLEAVPVWNREYVIPRWQTVSGSQYAFSPATITALPDARLIQAMTYAILEAGEKAVNPPLVATQDVVRSDVSLYAGGITWVDEEYDEKLGAALRPLTQDLRGLPFGDQMAAESREMISQAFYLNKLNLPVRAPEMTAYEVGQRVQEYIRGALPIFEPMENEYNGGVCELTFDILMRAGAFGSVRDIPPSLRGQDLPFRYESPLHDAIEQQKGQKFLEAKALLAEAVDIDQSAVYLLDTSTALRDALTGVGVPAKWMNSKDDVDESMAEVAQQQATAASLEEMQQGADVAATIGEAKQALA
jgi:hypothetical protein